MGASAAAYLDAGLTQQEYERIRNTLGRDPNPLELGMFGVLWSEHCSYKHSRPLLRRLPSRGAHVLQGPGENAGAVDIGDGLAAVMKIESHNHPSAVEPFQGAATGVGGILRDIFTMGARPVALMDALFFGEPGAPRTAYLLGGVVDGISFYGNCVGVPTVGGSIAFDTSYSGNPLVNALCLGIARHEQIVTARADTAGDLVILVGSATGRDGIAGASFASAELSRESEDRRPAVQVGNPFLEKLLIEACMELAEDRDVVAMQDLGAAGLTGAATEIVAKGRCGIEIDVARVARREHGMTPAEVMLSESQERMLVVVRPGAEDRVRQRFARWDLEADVVGRVTADGLVRVLDGSRTVAELPAAFLSGGAPEFAGVLESDRPPLSPLDDDVETLLGPVPDDLGAVLLQLLRSPNLCSRRPVFEQYDYMVQTNTVVAPGEGAAVLRVKGTHKGLALGMGSAPRACAKDPRNGGAMVVAEATRNVACAGARPIALTDCLNFGDPESPRVWTALEGVVEGIREASLALDVPIISGNVSLYNETEGNPILPTPVVGALGLLPDVGNVARASFAENQVVWLLGPLQAWLPTSEYAHVIHHTVDGSPSQINLDLERRVQACIQDLIGSGAVRSCTDVSEGGLVCALAEMALAGSVGVDCQGAWVPELESGASERPDAILFGEAPSRIIFAAAADKEHEVLAAANRWGVPVERLGVTGGTSIRIGKLLSVSVADARVAWGEALDALLGSKEGV